MPQTQKHSLSVAITGSGGAGAMTAGGLLLDGAAKAGWYGLQTRSVGPQIRGGEAAALLRLSVDPVEIHGAGFDLLVALDWSNFKSFAAEIRLTSDSLVICDPASGDLPDAVTTSRARVIELPLTEMAAETAGGRLNMIALGLAAGIVGMKQKAILELVKQRIASKGEAAVEASVACVSRGLAAAKDITDGPRLAPAARAKGKHWIITGNEAAGLGAVRGGVRFAAAYPITPATEILEWLSHALADAGGRLVQAEDELASINMIIGASYGGVPSLTATSGPGLALMTESIGLATSAEVPIVVIDVMRGGPSTGIPTKSEQSDLNIAVYGLHGDAPHVVVAPLSIGDCVFTTQWAVHLAEAMQVPAIVLSDQFLGQARAVINKPANLAFAAKRLEAVPSDQPYLRYAMGNGPVSAMARPGTPGCQYTADGLEHGPRGTPSTRAEDHIAQLEKRRDKLETFDYGQHWADIEGEGDVAVITWGSSAQAAREAVRQLGETGIHARLIAVRLLAPTRPEQMAAALDGVRSALVVEQSHSGQFYHYLRAHYDLPPDTACLKRPGPLTIGSQDIRGHIEKEHRL
jgi:2-oxoglutarate ferredoxin oxidoreductase subunit alpha